MRSFLLVTLLTPVIALAGEGAASDSSLLSYELRLNGQVLRGAGVVASDQRGFTRWGTDRGTLRLSCTDGRRTLTSMPLFEGGLINFVRSGDQIHVQVRETKVQSQDEQIKQVPASECRELAAAEVVVVDRTFTVPADTGGNAVTVDIGDGYSLRATSQDLSGATSH